MNELIGVKRDGGREFQIGREKSLSLRAKFESLSLMNKWIIR